MFIMKKIFQISLKHQKFEADILNAYYYWLNCISTYKNKFKKKKTV